MIEDHHRKVPRDIGTAGLSVLRGDPNSYRSLDKPRLKLRGGGGIDFAEIPPTAGLLTPHSG